ncbi:hypothetical protein C818_02261 [Lachnospiraceae bacterium MD308]|nr:hypothetical protein C818_02261 [Lachnospiraceae bacterium MD308]MCI8504453.1 hypothetical protein [Dorea sp.]
MRYDAKELSYEKVEVFGEKAIFTDVRVERRSVPKGLYQYEVRHDDESFGYPVEIAKGILVNFYGTLLTKNRLHGVEEHGWMLVEDEEWYYIGERNCTLEEYLKN